MDSLKIGSGKLHVKSYSCESTMDESILILILLFCVLKQMKQFQCVYTMSWGAPMNALLQIRLDCFQIGDGIYNQTGLKFIIDSMANIKFLMKSSQDDLTASVTTITAKQQCWGIVMIQEATLMCHSVDWGKQAVQSLFLWLKYLCFER